MKKIVLALMLCLGTLPAQAADFSKWAVMIIAGDNHAHSGGPSKVFDNARRDLAKAFAGIGFNPNNMVQFSVEPDKDSMQLDPQSVAASLWDLTNRAPAGCLIYYTSHGTPKGIIMDQGQMTPDNWGHIVNNACGSKPAVIVMSACFAGQFLPELGAGNRLVVLAARPDRTSFGCGEDDYYTFFDGCFLQSLPGADGFVNAALRAKECVAKLEAEMKIEYPSEPMVALGREVGTTLNWR